MKKMMFLSVIIGILIVGANAFALDYSQIDGSNIFGTSGTVLKESGFPFGFNNIASPFTSASITLDLTGKGNWEDVLKIGNNAIYTFDNNHLAYTFTAGSSGTLALLNSAISNHAVTFSLFHQTGNSTITSATLTGTMAPEPISMALVGAGIVALPFARRLKKSLSKEA